MRAMISLRWPTIFGWSSWWAGSATSMAAASSRLHSMYFFSARFVFPARSRLTASVSARTAATTCRMHASSPAKPSPESGRGSCSVLLSARDGLPAAPAGTEPPAEEALRRAGRASPETAEEGDACSCAEIPAEEAFRRVEGESSPPAEEIDSSCVCCCGWAHSLWWCRRTAMSLSRLLASSEPRCPSWLAPGASESSPESSEFGAAVLPSSSGSISPAPAHVVRRGTRPWPSSARTRSTDSHALRHVTQR
mmetsp:Transcript_108877/g.347261  ORF Transcript_108877/g.347261 Transcript_108877/m.347261 type:complete len:251 (+) Transcript_108877:445-1197(+)